MKSGIGNLQRKVHKQKWLVGVAVLVLMLALLLGTRIYASSVMIQQVEFQQYNGIYLVNTKEQLLALGGATISETKGKYFQLTTDIVVPSLNTAQKGNFAGTLDGDGHMVTYKNVNITSQDDQAGQVTVNEGILFGTLTEEGTVENLFLNIGSISYSFENTAVAEVTGGDITMADYKKQLYGKADTTKITDANDIAKILKLPRYIKKSGNYVEDTGEIVFAKGETKTFYYKQVLSNVEVKKESVITTKNGKNVRFGVVCGENQGTIQNIEVRGEAVNAETKDDSYTQTDNYDSQAVEVVQYYKVVMQADNGTRVQVTQEGERGTGTYFHLYWKKDSGYDYATPLYLRDANGNFDLTQPLYETKKKDETTGGEGEEPTGGEGEKPTGGEGEEPTGGNEPAGGNEPTGENKTTEGEEPTEGEESTEGAETKFDLSKPIERDGYTATAHDGEVAEISTTEPGDMQIAVSQADTDGKQRYLYAYEESKGYADLTIPLYQKNSTSWNMSSPIYFETLKSDGTAVFDLNHKVENLELVPVKADEAKKADVIKKKVDGSYCYLYWRNDNDYDYSVPLYVRDTRTGEFDLDKPLYEESIDGKTYDLTKLTTNGTAAAAPTQTAGSTAPIKPFENLTVSATDSNYKYLYAYHDNYADFTMPLYNGTTANMTDAIYAPVVVTENENTSNYFNTKEKVTLVPRTASADASTTIEAVQTEEAVSYYLYKWDREKNTWDFSVPLYARDEETGKYNVTKPLYINSTADDTKYDLSKLTLYGQEAKAKICLNEEMPKYATESNNSTMGITAGNYSVAALDSNRNYLYAYYDGFVDLSKPLYTGTGTAFADAQYELVTDAGGNQYFNLNQKQDLVPAVADSAVTAEIIRKKTIPAEQAGESAKDKYYYLYWFDGTTLNYTVPLYARDVDGKFDLNKPLYITKEDNSTVFDLTTLTSDGRAANAETRAEGTTAPISPTSADENTELTVVVTIASGDKNLYLYAYHDNYVDLTMPLYTGNTGKMTDALYKLVQDTATLTFYYNLLETQILKTPTLEEGQELSVETAQNEVVLGIDGKKYLNEEQLQSLVPGKASAEVTEEVIRESEGACYYLYRLKDDGTYDFTMPLYTRDSSSGKLNLAEPLYQISSSDSTMYDLSKVSEYGRTANAKTEAGAEAPITAGGKLQIPITEQSGEDNLYLYVYKDNYVDLTKPLYTNNNVNKAIYEKLTDSNNIAKFNLNVRSENASSQRLALVKVPSVEGTSEQQYEPLLKEEMEPVYKYLYAYFEGKGYDMTTPLYDDNGTALYEIAADKKSFDLSKPVSKQSENASEGTVPIYKEDGTEAEFMVTYAEDKEKTTYDRLAPIEPNKEELFKNPSDSITTSGKEAQLIVGGIAGSTKDGKLTGIVQQAAVSAQAKEDNSRKGEQTITAGGLTGTAEGKTSIETSLIKAAANAVSGKNVSGHAGDIVGEIKGTTTEAPQISACIIDNETSGTVYGTISADLTAVIADKIANCYVNSETPAAGLTKLSDLKPSGEPSGEAVVSGKPMEGWWYLSTEITGRESNLYVPKWLYKAVDNVTFGYTLDASENLTVRLHEGTTETGMELSTTEVAVKYQYYKTADSAANSKLVTKLKSNAQETNAQRNELKLELATSGYAYLNNAYASDGRYYYNVAYEQKNKPVYRDGKNYLPEFGKEAFYDETEVAEYIEVFSDASENSTAVFYYTQEADVTPTVDEQGRPGNGTQKCNATYDSSLKKWVAKVKFENASMVINGFWIINDNIYESDISDNYSKHNQIMIQDSLEANRYYLDDTGMIPVYEALTSNTVIYAKQRIRIKDCKPDITYYYLFSEEKIDITSEEVIAEQRGKMNLYDQTQGYLEVSAYSVGKSYYFYLFKEKDSMKTGVQEFQFTIGNELNIIPSITSGSVIINGTVLTLDLSMVENGMEVRYLQSNTELGLKTLTGRETMIYDGTPIQLTRSGDSNSCYVYVQVFGTNSVEQNICSSVIGLSYIFKERQAVPEVTPNTISIQHQDDNTDGATSCEVETKVTFDDTEESIIVYMAGTSFNKSSLTVTQVTDTALLKTLSAVTEQTTVLKNTLYVKNNELWYQMSGGAQLYDANVGIVLENTTVSSLTYYIGAISFAEDREYSELVRYVYKINPMDEAEQPVPVLSTNNSEPTEVLLGSSLFFQCMTAGAEMYYTTDNTTPATTETGSTHKYDNETGILVEGEYNSNFRVRILAIRRNAEGQELSRVSQVGYYTYKITQQEQAAAPSAIPETTQESPTQLSPGEKILLNTSTKGADIYYTTDGSEPEVELTGTGSEAVRVVKNGILYDSTKGIVMPDEGSGYFTIKAIAVKEGLAVSDTVQLSYSYPGQVQPPYATPASGTVELGTTVALKNATEDAIIYFEVAYGEEEPAEPTITSGVYDSAQPFSIDQKTTIKAFAMKDGVKSAVAVFTYTTSDKLAAPSASLESGSIVARSTMLKLTNSGEGTIYYTTDGSDPTDAANTNVVLGNTLLLDGDYESIITVKACVKKSGSSDSDVATFTYQISKYQGGVTSDTESGSELSQGATINLISDVSDAVIYYTVDGSTPGSGSSSGTSVTLNQGAGTMVTVKALAIPKNLTLSSAGNTTAIFTYKLKDAIPAPTATPAGGVLTTATTVRLSAVEGNIYYTTDGTDPTASSTQYAGPITVNKTMTIKAIAITDSGENSAVATFEYTAAMRAVKPTASIESQTVEPGTMVQLSTQTNDAVIYYSTDGTVPSLDNLESLLIYDGEGISINRTVTLQAVAYREGLQLSNVASYTYEVTTIPAVEAKKKAEEAAAADALKETDATGLESKQKNALSSNGFKSGIYLIESEYDTCVLAEEGTVPNGTTLVSRQKEAKDEAKENLKAVMGESYDILEIYDIRLYHNEVTIQPDGQVQIGIPVPEGYENAALTIVYIDENNQVHLCETWRSDNMMYALTDHFSLYGLAGVQQQEQSEKQLDVAYTAIGVAGITAVAGILFAGYQFIHRRRKRKQW